MAQVIRIDEDVWNWLKQNASPLEDTPNSVLRRIAGLDTEENGSSTQHGEPKMVTTVHARKGERTNSGKNLQRIWNIPAVHVLYHKDGNYYNHLNNFPGALCDPNGYVIFNSEKEYKTSPYLKHGVQLHPKDPQTGQIVPIDELPMYVRMK